MKAGCLLFSQKRNARTPSGKELPAVLITRMDGDSHRYSRSDREAYSGVKAFYTSTKAGQRKSEVAGMGISGRAKTLRATFASEAYALPRRGPRGCGCSAASTALTSRWPTAGPT